MVQEINRRILLVDDNPQLHADYRKLLGSQGDGTVELDSLAGALFGEAVEAPVEEEIYELDSAYQGEEALVMVREARRQGRPYAMAFVDVRMPPGWDGIETLARLWEVDPDLQAVICTAFSDYSYEQMLGKLGRSQNLLILKKPFDRVEVQQLASALTQKWSVTLSERLHLEEVRAYAASLETVNRALASDKAMAQAFHADHARFAARAAKRLEVTLAELNALVAPQFEAVAEVRQCVEVARQVAECLLLDAGVREENEPCPVQEALGRLSTQLAERGIGFECSTSPDFPMLLEGKSAQLVDCLADLGAAARDGGAQLLRLSLRPVAGAQRLQLQASLIFAGAEEAESLALDGEPFDPELDGRICHLVQMRYRCRHLGMDCQSQVDGNRVAVQVIADSCRSVAPVNRAA